jgi:hypothetical protein
MHDREGIEVVPSEGMFGRWKDGDTGDIFALIGETNQSHNTVSKINLTIDEEVLIDLGILDISDIDWSRVKGSDSKRFDVTRIVPIIREWDIFHKKWMLDKTNPRIWLKTWINYTYLTEKTFLGSKDYLLIAINGFYWSRVIISEDRHDVWRRKLKEHIDNYSNISIDSIHHQDYYGTLVRIPIN